MSEQYKTRAEKRKLQEKGKKKSKKTKSSKSLVKRVMLALLFLFIVAAIATGGVFAYWVTTAPEIDDKLLKDPVSSKVFDKNGDLYTEVGSETRDYVKYEDIPKLMEKAILATEDVRFYKHHGVDVIRLGGAVVANLTGGFGSQGGSTITQQVVKNSFLKPEKKMKRKVQEMWLAFQLEQKYSKQQIFEMYVNKVYMSSGIHGFSTASKLYFGKELKDLNLSEAATLAGMPQSPNNYNPFDYPENAEKRRNIVLKLMENAEFIKPEEREKAAKTSVASSLVPEKKRENTTNNKHNAIIDQVINEVEEIGDYNIYTDGLQIYTSIDPKAQELMEKILDTDAYIYYPDDKFQAGTVFMDTKTGEIQAIGGGRNQKVARGFNYATDLKNRQPGSTIKPILDYAPAIENLQWSTYHQINDEKMEYSSGQTIGSATGTYKGWVSMREALYKSLNVPAVKTLKEVGFDKADEFTNKLGIDFGDIYESSAIGGVRESASPLQMAGAYAAFGNEGIYNKPHVIKKVVLRDNDTVVETAPKPEVAMKDYTAFMISDMLKDVVKKGTGVSANIPGLPLAAKTGTTNYSEKDRIKYNISKSSSPDSWFVGYTTEYTMSVWTGYDQQFKNPLSQDDTRIAAKIFKAMMQEMSSSSVDDFKQPNSVVKVPVEIGSNPAVKASEYTPSDKVTYEYFVKGHEPSKTSVKYSKLDAPSGLTATYDEAGKKINVQWSYGSDKKPEFDVKVALDGGEQKLLTTTKETQFSLSDPQPGSTYDFYVTAIVDNQKSDSVKASVTIPELAEEEPEEEPKPNDQEKPTTPDDEQQDNDDDQKDENQGNNGNTDEGKPTKPSDGSGSGNENGNNGNNNGNENNNGNGNNNGNNNGSQDDGGTSEPAAQSDETSYLIPPAINESVRLLPRNHVA